MYGVRSGRFVYYRAGSSIIRAPESGRWIAFWGQQFKCLDGANDLRVCRSFKLDICMRGCVSS